VSKQLVSCLVSSQCLKPILQWGETLKQQMASGQNHSAQNSPWVGDAGI